MGVVVMAVYRPKEGRQQDLERLIAKHVPLLRDLGLATERPVLLLRARGGGEFVEVFEWTSEEAAGQAHDDPRVAEIWNTMGEMAAFAPLASLEGASSPFPHFDVVEGIVT
ncbi:MAG: hypothetical protein ACYTG6_14650 [Planctomycetota bacterium]|jgi:hypothetical protein